MDPQALLEPDISPGKRLITQANAREMAAKSHEARRQRRIEREAELAKPQPAETPEPIAETVNGVRVKEYDEQLVRIRGMLKKEKDPRSIYALAQAVAKLEEVYCRFASIPGPGNFKPVTARRARSQSSYGPIEGPSEPPAPQ